MPVEIGAIQRELKKLWDQGGEVMTRASLMNLAVYSQAPDSLAANTALISQITEDHACRAIVIAADPTAQKDRVEAWISAHCHISRAGSKQICSEQLSFSLGGPCTSLLPNIVFSHLDSDLPFYLWWQGELPDPIDPQLWTWVDRLLYDSQGWRDFESQARLVERAQEEAKHRVVLCDLNWTRLVQMRLALAQFFDQPISQQCLGQIERIEIEHAPGFRSTALLLAGWFAAQLRWRLDSERADASLHFVRDNTRGVHVALDEKGNEPISRCSLFCGQTTFSVAQRRDADLLDVSMNIEGIQRLQQLMPAGSNEPVALVSEELMRGGPHRVYLRAVQAVRGLL